jgi:hypothetical protein
MDRMHTMILELRRDGFRVIRMNSENELFIYREKGIIPIAVYLERAGKGILAYQGGDDDERLKFEGIAHKYSHSYVYPLSIIEDRIVFNRDGIEAIARYHKDRPFYKSML